jgi:hypothetical protein
MIRPIDEPPPLTDRAAAAWERGLRHPALVLRVQAARVVVRWLRPSAAAIAGTGLAVGPEAASAACSAA